MQPVGFGLIVNSVHEGQDALKTNRQMAITKKRKKLRNRLQLPGFYLTRAAKLVTLFVLTLCRRTGWHVGIQMPTVEQVLCDHLIQFEESLT